VASLISSARWPRTLDRTNLFCSSWLISRVFAPFSRRTAVAVTLSCTGQVSRSEALVVVQLLKRVKVSAVAPLSRRRHPLFQLRQEPFGPVSRKSGIRQRSQWQGTQSASSRNDMCALTPRSSGRVKDKVPSSDVGARAAQLNR
jgi:hypothetical protein